jgi:predicted regulator of Ras-like GTPase activity (Roadblock/LC7/MglB family)
MSLDLDAVIQSIIEKLSSRVYFILITTPNGVIVKSYINEDEFNKSSISLNISQLYETAEEITEGCGIHSPDFVTVHSDNYFIISIKILEKIIILLTEDQIELKNALEIINACVKSE